ncbi:Serine/threonine kinase [Tulasnella sp. UAMH 9824]|nr:Serine/threonine kinase [Tulasnella sp. UAMH 9824]
MTFAFQRLRMQASDSQLEKAPKVEGVITTDFRSTVSRGYVYEASARFSPAGRPQPLPQQQQVQDRRIGNDMVATNKLLAEIHAIEAPQRTQPHPRPRPLPPLPKVQQSSPQQMEQITSRVGQMSIRDPYAETPPAGGKPLPPRLPPTSYERPDERGPDRYEQGPATAPQQRFPQHERQPPEREEMGAYNYDNRHPSGAPPPPKAYPLRPVAPRYANAQQQSPAAATPSQRQQQQVQQRRTRREVGLDDFSFLAVIGKGNLGKVMLAEEKRTKSLFAIKVWKKEFIIDNDEVERSSAGISTQSMKGVFLIAAQARHPFLLGLHCCFQTETRVFFAMEYISGGDLLVNVQRRMFSLSQARFYAQEILLAVEYLHSQGVIHRKVALENILLTLDGHVKVAGYGACKEGMWYGYSTQSFCGVPDFMAPEILLEQKYGRAVDWWAFGVLLYQMILGTSPFRGDDEDEIFDAILEDEPIYPIMMPRDAVSIVQKLLTRDPNRRLGSSESDAEEIKQHSFFKDTDWGDVLNKRIPAPYLPTIASATDTSNFDTEFTRDRPTLTPVLGRLPARDQARFQDFSWTADWADT